MIDGGSLLYLWRRSTPFHDTDKLIHIHSQLLILGVELDEEFSIWIGTTIGETSGMYRHLGGMILWKISGELLCRNQTICLHN